MNMHVDDLETRFAQCLPAKLIDPNTRQLQQRLVKHMNGLGKLDEKTNEVFFDETAFHRMLSDFKDYLPPGFEDGYAARMKALPDNRLDGRQLKPVKWHELVSYVPTLKEYPQAPSQVASLTNATSLEELRKNLQQLVPEIKDSVFDPTTFTPNFEQVLMNLAEAPAREATLAPADFWSVWNCFVNHWGWWGAALAVAAIIVIGTALGIFGAWTVVLGTIIIGVISGYLLAAIIGLGGVAGVLLACIFGWR